MAKNHIFIVTLFYERNQASVDVDTRPYFGEYHNLPS
jgi:hypothetical protein